MCNLLNNQTRDLEEPPHQRKKQTKKTDAETIKIITPAKILLSSK
jgi:hypothetical protein